MRPPRAPKPLTRAGWAAFYASEFGRTGRSQATHMALWYLIMALAEADGMYP